MPLPVTKLKYFKTLGLFVLGAGTTHSCFHSVGQWYTSRQELYMSVRGMESSYAESFRILDGRSIGWVDFLFFSL